MGLAVQVSVSMRKQGYNSSRSQFSCSQQMAIQMQWLLTETLVHRRKEFLLMESISGASVAVWFHVVALTFTNTATYVGSKKQTKKSSVTVNVTLKCINRRDDCRTHQLHHTYTASAGNTLCAAPAQRNSGKTWIKVRATRGEQHESTEPHSIWTRRTGKNKWSFHSGECNKWHEKSSRI